MGSRLRGERVACGMNVQQLGRLARVPGVWIMKFELGEVCPRAEYVERLDAVLKPTKKVEVVLK